ncbi:hypothetical protein CALCODRAFT_482629 [Calocera cornea HHB12733]|uniref:DUF4604 domain-containing protein n=1 Tax=Calocera cornea HHB12733 TaxID=1353952 RepID=A0A165GHX0_9BASI|nr:hypothetical protein CALCODRAFT_482629 [Calocera cornea HHB12733]
MAREPNRVQLSKLAYQDNVPSFLQKMKARMSGQAVDEDEPSYGDEDGGGEWEESGDGRPAIPRRPGIPERPKEGEWGSNKTGKDRQRGPGPDGRDEDDEGDDAPQIVVLKTGKHLSAEDVENERRAAKGLPPLLKAQPTDGEPISSAPPVKAQPEKDNGSMSFSSSKKASTGGGASSKKRKIIGADDDDESQSVKAKESKPSKKQKKPQKGLLSFQDDDG